MTTTQPHSRARRIARAVLFNGLLLIMSFAFAIALAEIAIRIVAPQQLIIIRPDLWQATDTVGWARRPGIHVEMNTGERTVDIYTNAAGFRTGSDRTIPQGRRVLVLGDSFMEALQVDHEDSFAGLLEQKLAAGGLPVGVYNAGVNGWGPSQYLLRARQLLERDDYDLVVTSIYLGNDVVTERHDYMPPRRPVERHHFRLPRSLRWSEFVDAALRPINDALEVRSHLFVFVRNRLETLRMKAGLHPMRFPPELRRATAGTPRWALTADICRDIQELAEANGARALFLLVPAPFQVDSAAFAASLAGYGVSPEEVDLDQPTRLLSAELAARGVPFVDVLPGFRATHAQGVRLFGRVDPHLSPEGNQRLAELVAPEAARLLIGQITTNASPGAAR